MAPLALGVAPLLLGTGIFIAWVETGWPGWILAGLAMLLAGLGSMDNKRFR
jgi:hypothetical protein